MSYDASNIINIVTRISPAGLSTADFGSAMIFADNSEANGIADDTVNTYTKLSDLAVNYPSTTEVYKCASVWFGTIPNPGKIQVYQMEDIDISTSGAVVGVLNKARQSYWWYFTFFNKNVYSHTGFLPAIVSWGDDNNAMVPNLVIGSQLDKVLDSADTDDICSALTTQGTRHCFSLGSGQTLASGGAYAGVSLCAQFGSVLYSGQNTTITGEFKKLSVGADDWSSSQTTAMTSKKCAFYTKVDLQGSEDSGRVINAISHSSYGEWIDDVINLDAFVNSLKVALYNVLANQTTKLPQTPAGQQILISAANDIGQQYLDNGYLGPREYTDPDDGIKKQTVGFEVLTQPEDILTLSDANRAARQSAPIRMRIFKAGAIHHVDVTVDVY